MWHRTSILPRWTESDLGEIIVPFCVIPKGSSYLEHKIDVTSIVKLFVEKRSARGVFSFF